MLFTKGDQCDTIHREEEGVFVLNDIPSCKNATPPHSATADAC